MLQIDLIAVLPILIVCGVAGTAVMTLYLKLMGALLRQILNAARVLGTLVTFSTTDSGHLSNKPVAVISGIVLHYMIGILFMIAYFLLWKSGIGRPDLITGLIFGFVSGLIAVTCWSATLYIHPKPPILNLKIYLTNVFAAHFIFVAGCFVMFLILT
jgi:hypothetical protein